MLKTEVEVLEDLRNEELKRLLANEAFQCFYKEDLKKLKHGPARTEMMQKANTYRDYQLENKRFMKVIDNILEKYRKKLKKEVGKGVFGK